jgi:hypothetical protein
MSTNDTSYGVAATSERELTIDKLDAVSGAIDTFFHALLRPAALARSGALGGSNQAAAPPFSAAGDRSIMRLMERSLKAPERPHQRRSERQHESRRQER